MPTVCCVRGCQSYLLQKKVSLFRFPRRDRRLRRLWLEAIDRLESSFRPLSARVCSEHFINGRPTKSFPVLSVNVPGKVTTVLPSLSGTDSDHEFGCLVEPAESKSVNVPGKATMVLPSLSATETDVNSKFGCLAEPVLGREATEVDENIDVRYQLCILHNEI